MSTTQTPATALCRGSLWRASISLWRREMVRFFRQRNRVISAMATPLIFWGLLGAGLNRSFTLHGSQSNYLEYFFPGTVLLMVMFTAIFSTFSVIEDRREGFMQGILVAPIPRLAIVLGKVLGGASISLIQGILLLALWPLISGWPGLENMLLACGILFILAMGLTALGLLVAWPCESTASFHAIMNLFLMPMWFMSGAVFPPSQAPMWMKWIMWANPLTYGQSAFGAALRGESFDAGLAIDLNMKTLIIIIIVATIAINFLASLVVSRTKRNGMP